MHPFGGFPSCLGGVVHYELDHFFNQTCSTETNPFLGSNENQAEFVMTHSRNLLAPMTRGDDSWKMSRK